MQQTEEEGKMQQRNDGSKNKTVLAKKIGSIISTACGNNALITNMAFGIGIPAKEKREFNQERPISLKKTHSLDDKSLKLSCKWHPNSVSSSGLSAVLASTGLRKWKSSLKKVAKVKLRLKDMGKDGREKGKANELELCKKRILMGEKCKALNLSGVLHYDKQGILLPED